MASNFAPKMIQSSRTAPLSTVKRPMKPAVSGLDSDMDKTVSPERTKRPAAGAEGVRGRAHALLLLGLGLGRRVGRGRREQVGLAQQQRGRGRRGGGGRRRRTGRCRRGGGGRRRRRSRRGHVLLVGGADT